MARRIDGKCGIIKKFIRNQASIKLKDGSKVKIGVGFLKAPERFGKLSLKQMRKIINKPHMGYKKEQKVCISSEEPLYG